MSHRSLLIAALFASLALVPLPGRAALLSENFIAPALIGGTTGSLAVTDRLALPSTSKATYSSGDALFSFTAPDVFSYANQQSYLTAYSSNVVCFILCWGSTRHTYDVVNYYYGPTEAATATIGGNFGTGATATNWTNTPTGSRIDAYPDGFVTNYYNLNYYDRIAHTDGSFLIDVAFDAATLAGLNATGKLGFTIAASSPFLALANVQVSAAYTVSQVPLPGAAGMFSAVLACLAGIRPLRRRPTRGQTAAA